MTDHEAIKIISRMILDMEYPNGKYHDDFTKEEGLKHLALYRAKSALQEREERSKGCRFCFDATLEPDLEGCDLSYHDVGESEQQKRIMIRSGNGKPMAIMFEELSGNQWHTVGIYEPKFCPMCGRPLKGEDND